MTKRSRSWMSWITIRKLPSSRSAPSLTNADKQFENAETDRDHIYESTSREQQLEFLHAEAIRAEAQESRDQLFRTLLEEVRKMFVANQADRETHVQELGVKHDRIFKEHDISRNAAFEKTQSYHEKTFRESREGQQKHAIWYAEARTQVLVQGRRQREDAYDRLMNLMLDEFNVFLRGEENTFLDAQRQRDELVSGMLPHNVEIAVESEKSNDSKQFTTHMIYPPSHLRARGLSPVLIRTQSLLRQHPRIPSPDFVRSRTPSYPRPSPITIVPPQVWPHTSNPCHSSRYSNESSGPSEPMPHLNYESQEKVQGLQDDIGQLFEYHDAVFLQKEGQRRGIFTNEQEARDVAFNEAEAQRFQVEAQRESISTALQVECENSFEQMQHHSSQRMKQKDEMRDSIGESRRQQSSDLLLTFDTVFTQDQSWFENQFNAADTAEKEWVNLFKLIIHQRFFISLELVVQKVLQQQSNHFASSMSRFRSQLGLKLDTTAESEPPSPLQSQDVGEDVRETRSYTIRRRSFSRSRSWSSSIQARVTQPIMIQSISDQIPYVISMPCAVVPGQFVPQTLFEGNVIMKNLPVPKRSSQLENLAISAPIAILKKQQIKFERAQNDRRKQFKNCSKKQHQQFAINEVTRQEKFRTKQAQWKELAANREAKQSLSFALTMQRWEKDFYYNEQQRDDMFWRMMQKQEQHFRMNQQNRDNLFYEQQKRLQEQCYRCESVRQQDWITWEVSIKQEWEKKLEEWRNKFEDQAREQEGVFSILLSEM